MKVNQDKYRHEKIAKLASIWLFCVRRLLVVMVTMVASVATSQNYDDMDVSAANTPTYFSKIAQWMRSEAIFYRNQAQQEQAMQMMYPNVDRPSGFLCPSWMQNALEAESAAKYWESLDAAEKNYFSKMKAATKRGRSQQFIDTRDRLQQMLPCVNSQASLQEAYIFFSISKRAILAFRHSIDPSLGAGEWVRKTDITFGRYLGYQMAIEQKNAIKEDEAYLNRQKIEMDRENMDKRRCYTCNTEYRVGPGHMSCPRCSVPRYGLPSVLVDDPDHPGEKVWRTYSW